MVMRLVFAVDLFLLIVTIRVSESSESCSELLEDYNHCATKPFTDHVELNTSLQCHEEHLTINYSVIGSYYIYQVDLVCTNLSNMTTIIYDEKLLKYAPLRESTSFHDQRSFSLTIQEIDLLNDFEVECIARSCAIFPSNFCSVTQPFIETKIEPCSQPAIKPLFSSSSSVMNINLLPSLTSSLYLSSSRHPVQWEESTSTMVPMLASSINLAVTSSVHPEYSTATVTMSASTSTNEANSTNSLSNIAIMLTVLMPLIMVMILTLTCLGLLFICRNKLQSLEISDDIKSDFMYNNRPTQLVDNFRTRSMVTIYEDINTRPRVEPYCSSSTPNQELGLDTTICPSIVEVESLSDKDKVTNVKVANSGMLELFQDSIRDIPNTDSSHVEYSCAVNGLNTADDYYISSASSGYCITAAYSENECNTNALN